MRVLFTTKDNSIMGQADFTRYNQLPWWKKVICFFWRPYKRRFIDIKGFACDIDTAEFSKGDVLYISKSKPGELTTNLNKDWIKIKDEFPECNKDVLIRTESTIYKRRLIEVSQGCIQWDSQINSIAIEWKYR